MSSRMAHVALNAHLLDGRASYRSAGVHQYIDQLLRHLPNADANFRYTVFVGEGQPQRRDARTTLQRSLWPTRRPIIRILWEQLAQPIALARVRPDLLHSLAFVSPLIAPCPSVVTVYDLSFKLPPEKFRQRAARRLYLSLFTAHACRQARRVIAISESTKAEVMRFFKIDPQHIDVAYPGLDPAFRPLPQLEVEAFRAHRGLPARFILYLGTLEPRKNLDPLIRAFARVRTQFPHLKLILAGAKGWLYQDLFKRVQDLHLEESVFFPGFIPAEELALWYNAAAMFAYPSVYEGFGLPVVEALACGCPVVTTNASSLPEAGGEAAILVPPNDVPVLADALVQALTLEPEVTTRGPAHAARFTWEAAAAQTAASYRRALDLGV